MKASQRLNADEKQAIASMRGHMLQYQIAVALGMPSHWVSRYYKEMGWQTPPALLGRRNECRPHRPRRTTTTHIREELLGYRDDLDRRLQTNHDIIQQSEHLDYLVLSDLPALRALYEKDLSASDMAHELGTTVACVMEGLEVLRIMGKIPRAAAAPPPPPPPDPTPAPEPIKQQRPPAVYSNRSPYGLARPGA